MSAPPADQPPARRSSVQFAVDSAKRAEHHEFLLTKTRAREIFDRIDVDKSGTVSPQELLHMLSSLHGEGALSPAQFNSIAEILASSDADGSGDVDLDEFTRALVSIDQAGLGEAAKIIKRKGRAVTANDFLFGGHNGPEIRFSRKKEGGHQQWIVHPLSGINSACDVAVAAMIVITIITLPLSLGWFEMYDALLEFHLTLDLLFLLDVVKNFNTGYVDIDGAIITDRRSIAKNYIKGWFAIDLSSSIPFDFIPDVDDGGKARASKLIKAVRILRITKLLRLMRLSKLARYFRSYLIFLEEKVGLQFSDGGLQLMQLGTAVLIVIHWMGCMQWMLCRLNAFPEESWVVHAELMYPGHVSGTKHSYERPHGVTVGMQYKWSCFKSAAQMIGLGFENPPVTNVACNSITPWCTVEHWCTLGALYIGSIVYALVIAVASSAVASSIARQALQDKRQYMGDYMKARKMPSELREKIRDLFAIKFENGQYFDEKRLFEDLTPDLRAEVQVHNNHVIIRKIPFVASTSMTFARSLATIVKPVMLFLRDALFAEGAEGDDMFFIQQGAIVLASKHLHILAKPYKLLGEGCFFGEVAVLAEPAGSGRRTLGATAARYTYLFRCHGKDLRALLDKSPDMKAFLSSVASERAQRVESLAAAAAEDRTKPQFESSSSGSTSTSSAPPPPMSMKGMMFDSSGGAATAAAAAAAVPGEQTSGEGGGEMQKTKRGLGKKARGRVGMVGGVSGRGSFERVSQGRLTQVEQFMRHMVFDSEDGKTVMGELGSGVAEPDRHLRRVKGRATVTRRRNSTMRTAPLSVGQSLWGSVA